MYYLKAFLNSFYKFDWLHAQADNSKKAANYVILLILLLSFVTSVFLSTIVPNKLRDLRNEVLSKVPAFEATLVNGSLSVTQLEQPFLYEDAEMSFGVNTNTSTEDFNFDTFVEGKDKDILYLTSSNIYSYDSVTKIKNVLVYDKEINKSFSKESFIKFTDNFLNNYKLFFAIFLIISFVGFSVFKLVNLLFITLLVWIINKNSETNNFKFSQIYTIGLFAITGPSIIVAFLRIFNYSIPFLYSILSIMILMIVTSKKYSSLELEEKNIETDILK